MSENQSTRDTARKLMDAHHDREPSALDIALGAIGDMNPGEKLAVVRHLAEDTEGGEIEHSTVSRWAHLQPAADIAKLSHGVVTVNVEGVVKAIAALDELDQDEVLADGIFDKICERADLISKHDHDAVEEAAQVFGMEYPQTKEI